MAPPSLVHRAAQPRWPPSPCTNGTTFLIIAHACHRLTYIPNREWFNWHLPVLLVKPGGTREICRFLSESCRERRPPS